MRQTICFPGKSTDGVGLDINTHARAGAAKLPLRRAKVEVQIQKVTLYTLNRKCWGHSPGWGQRGSDNNNEEPQSIPGVWETVAASSEEQTIIFSVSD